MHGEHEYQPILDFWFGKSLVESEILTQKSPLWWSKDERMDREIELRFGASLNRLINGELDCWKHNAESTLAMIILADQFSRNMFRNNAKAFTQDELALTLALEGLHSGIDMKLSFVQRIFFYMPLEHAESLAMQDRSVELFRKLYETAATDVQEKFNEHLDYAILHRQVIEKFGRFPHRNVILGRDSSTEELDYLKQPGAGF